MDSGVRAHSGRRADVGPGLYPEQILVYQAVTLKGIAFGNQAAVVITVPNRGSVQNATSLATSAPIAAQILVQGTTGVTITNMTVDRANNGVGGGCGTLDPIGIYYDYSQHFLQRHHRAGDAQQHLYASAGFGQQSGGQGACANHQGSETIGNTVEKNQVGRAGGFSLCPRACSWAIQTRSYVMSDNRYYVK